jgi:hypothetical protein
MLGPIIVPTGIAFRVPTDGGPDMKAACGPPNPGTGEDIGIDVCCTVVMRGWLGIGITVCTDCIAGTACVGIAEIVTGGTYDGVLTTSWITVTGGGV